MKILNIIMLGFLGSIWVSSAFVYAKDLPKTDKAAPQAAAVESKVNNVEATVPKAFTQAPWSQPPKIRITKWGEELRIEVQPNELMEKEQVLDIDSIALQTEQGDLLGFKTCDPQDSARNAEFMVDPRALKLEKVKIVVHGVRLDEWSSVVLLKEPEVAADPAPQTAPESAQVTQAAPVKAEPVKEVKSQAKEVTNPKAEKKSKKKK